MKAVRIADREVGPGKPVFIIAEAGVNHNGDLALAERLVHAAADVGADAVKFQTFRADALATAGAPRAKYQESAVGAGSQRDMLQALELSHDAHTKLQRLARNRGILFLSTPFDEASADFLDSLDVPAFKVGSGDLTNHPLLRHIAKKGRPMILSTGMATMAEAADAAQVVREAGAPLVVLHCTSAYPADLGSLNLRVLPALQERVGAPVGYSDHSTETWTGAAAVALGATLLEKHLTLDRSLPGPDHRASLEPPAFEAYVKAARGVQDALGVATKEPTLAEQEVARVARKSIVAARDLPAGARLRLEDLCIKRPGTGLSPARLQSVVGRTLARAVRADQVLAPEDLG